MMNKLIQLHPNDNVLVVRKKVLIGDREEIAGAPMVFDADIQLGHKIAARPIRINERIIKYGVPIGTATANIATGQHVHLHNMKSDYIPTYSFDNQFKDGQ